LAESIAGVNLNGTETDISISVNKNISWSYDTDGTRQAFKYDLMTVVLHEIAHGLGFTTSVKLAGTNETQAQWGIEGLPLIYDIFPQMSNGQVLTNTAIIGNPSTQLKAAITSQDVFFKISKGPLAKDFPKMYAPTIFRSGGTLSHLDEAKYPKGTENSLMSPQIGAAEINHYPGQVILGILNQIGWGVPLREAFIRFSEETNNKLVKRSMAIIVEADLTERGRIPKNIHGIVSAIKQDRTLREIAKNCFPKVEHLLLMSWLRAREIPIAVATNSIRATAETMLRSSGVLGFIDCLVTNEDVRRAKPDPEIYLVACEKLGVSPANTLVVEDHPYGVEAAKKAGCDVIQVSGPWDVTTKLIESHMLMNGRGF
jgi:beta-phosphoglucomutase-like phosphatase (HAD superfamily)